MAGEIGEKIRRLRKERGLTQSDLADRSGISFRAIQNLESGNRTPRADTIEMISQALGVPPGELLSSVGMSSKGLSPYAVTGPVTVKDGALILSQIADISPERRAFVLAVLFDDESLIPDEMSDLLDPVIQRASTIR